MATGDERLALGFQYHQAGRLAEAESHYRAVLQETPRHSHALHLLGLVCYQTRRFADAVEFINQALAAHGPHPAFHSNLAAAYLEVGRLIEATGHARAALRLQPQMPDAHHNLGVALRGQGQLDAAEAEFREAIRLKPNYLDAQCNLGAVLHQLGKLPEALAQMETAVGVAPNSALAHNTLGGVLLALGRIDEAAQHFDVAIRLQPTYFHAHNNLGVALENMSRFEEAIEAFRAALRLNPDYASAHNNLGSALLNQGKAEEALAEFQAALRADPNHAMATFNLGKLAGVGHYRFSDAEVSTIRELSLRTNLPAEARCRLHFALAQTFDRTGAYDEAFEQCRQANEVRKEMFRRRGAAYDHAAVGKQVDELIAVFTPTYFEKVRGFGVDSELLVFILGMPRSGTSLVEQILACHPRIHGAGELLHWNRIVEQVATTLGQAGTYPACLERLDAGTAQAIAQAHLQKLQELSGGRERVIDKAPFNFFHIGLIAVLFPRARIIHCRRDPRDTCLSCFFQNFAEPFPFTLDLEHLGQYYREYQRLMEHWAKVLPTPMFELSYEELTRDQETLSRRLIEFCGLPWDERVLRFYDNDRVVRTFSTLQVRQPMYRSSVGRWQHYERHLQPLLAALGEPA